MVDFEYKESYTVYDLQKVFALLRSPDGCPWDQAQTHESIRRNLIEEAYEAADAIDRADAADLLEELGDVLSQVVFHADIERNAGRFDLDGVADAACRKMISRHPAIFGDGTDLRSGANPDDWEALKREEKHQTTVASALEGVARALPALWRAEKVQKKAAKAGAETALPAVTEALRRCADKLEGTDDPAAQAGELLFLAAAAARLLDVDPEEALHAETDRFIARFAQRETQGELSRDGAPRV